jgi:hypothetical protein
MKIKHCDNVLYSKENTRRLTGNTWKHNSFLNVDCLCFNLWKGQNKSSAWTLLKIYLLEVVHKIKTTIFPWSWTWLIMYVRGLTNDTRLIFPHGNSESSLGYQSQSDQNRMSICSNVILKVLSNGQRETTWRYTKTSSSICVTSSTSSICSLNPPMLSVILIW